MQKVSAFRLDPPPLILGAGKEEGGCPLGAGQRGHALDPLGRGRVSVVVWAKGLTRLGLPMDMGSTMEAWGSRCQRRASG